ncbi:MAG: Serine/threonine protein kinase PrkC, regulator of stationary phase [Polyangiaceae bacterium]|jgi:serine/threonine-protein kinase|nr:Serine/threonine protein kinase PrkC, regulator of stationary phase [Polyangiaceae bacterium]
MTWGAEHTSRVHEDARDPTDVDTRRERVGTTIAGTYRVVGYLGSGGSSDVYRAEHVRLGKTVAIKVLRSDAISTRKLAQRFRKEARAVARLRSEHVVDVLDFGEQVDDAPYLVMEFLEGCDLRQLLRELTCLSLARAVHIVAEACFGLDAVHQAGLVHRDVKPENLFITHRDNGDDWCKVLDFGIAKMESSLSTSPGAILGTLRYMAPEQLIANGDVGSHTDIYGLGAILYECLSGRPAHSGNTPQQLMYSVMNTTPTRFSELRVDVPLALVDLVMRCLAKDHRSRPSSARALAAQLRNALGAHEGLADTTLSETNGLASRRLATLFGGRAWSWAASGAVAGALVSSVAATSLRAPVPARALPSQPRLVTPHGCSTPSPPALGGSAASATSVAEPPTESPSPSGRHARHPAAASASVQHSSLGRFDELSPYEP